MTGQSVFIDPDPISRDTYESPTGSFDSDVDNNEEFFPKSRHSTRKERRDYMKRSSMTKSVDRE